MLVLPINAKTENRIKVYFRLLHTTYSHADHFYKLFSYNPKPIHDLLALKRRPISLQKMPF